MNMMVIAICCNLLVDYGARDWEDGREDDSEGGSQDKAGDASQKQCNRRI
jgi:hypothetical protein